MPKRKHLASLGSVSDSEVAEKQKKGIAERCRIISRRYEEHLSGSRPPARRASLPLLFQVHKKARYNTRKPPKTKTNRRSGWQSSNGWVAPWPWLERKSVVDVKCSWKGLQTFDYLVKTTPPPKRVPPETTRFKVPKPGMTEVDFILTNVEFIPGNCTITLCPIDGERFIIEDKSGVPVLRIVDDDEEKSDDLVISPETVVSKTSVTVSTDDDDSIKCGRNSISFVLHAPARSEMKLLRICGLESAKKARECIKTEITWVWGNSTLMPSKDYRWLFPIQDVGPVLCCQGFDGPHTHEGDLKFAIDLAIFKGTKLYCPRDGVVVDYKDDSNEGGGSSKYEESGNYLSIVHEDGTCSEYVHLEHRGVKVTLGDFVERGALIGLSGNTGYSFGPHLHFHVKSTPDENAITIPIKFDNGAEGFIMDEGDFYDPWSNKLLRKVDVHGDS